MSQVDERHRLQKSPYKWFLLTHMSIIYLRRNVIVKQGTSPIETSSVKLQGEITSHDLPTSFQRSCDSKEGKAESFFHVSTVRRMRIFKASELGRFWNKTQLLISFGALKMYYFSLVISIYYATWNHIYELNWCFSDTATRMANMHF